jgi:outer membrane protein assembly factor BamB
MKTALWTKFFVLCLVMTLLGGSSAAYGDWAQFGGPDRNNSSPETGLSRTWPDKGPKVLWTISLGAGYGSPSVRDGEVYVLDRPDRAKDVLRCLSLETGEELWQFAYDAPGSVSHDGSRTAPTIDDDYIYTVGLLGHMHCIDRKTHQPVWSKHLLDDFGVSLPRWGVSQAPSLYKDLVIVAPQASDAFVIAMKRDTGDIVWRTPSLGNVGYSTPVITTLCGVDQAVMIGASDRQGDSGALTAGISLEDGTILWTYDGFQCRIPIPYATTLPGDRLFITGGYRAGSAMIELRRENDVFAVKELFKTDVCGSQIQQPLFYEGYLYVNSNSNEREDGLMCLTLDGEVKWKTRESWFSTSFERGPLLLADGLIFNLDGKKGSLHLIEPSPDGYKELAKADLLGGKEIWAPMALSQGKLLLRSQSEMKCLDVKNP